MYRKNRYKLVKIKSIKRKKNKSYKRPKNYIRVISFILLLFIICFFCYRFIRRKRVRKVISIEKVDKDKQEKLKVLLPRFHSYAQTFEDFILYYVFYDLENGFYVDVGANDPITFSTTKSFYQRGWHGINIEPLPTKFKNLVHDRPRDINLQMGAGSKRGNATLYVDGYNECKSSFIYNKEMNNPPKITIIMDTMANICKQFVPTGTQIDFLKIDVEGSEKDVLLGYDFENYRPKVICIESLNNTNNNNMPEYIDWEYILKENDYEFVYEYWINRFYSDKRRIGMKDKFNGIEYYVNKYKKN